ncbi:MULTISPECIES: hypothetical protein [unclassified Sphingobacterium]|uniref:hypothetical protein n=1 Tax=unclassified Sphingobacterium TaxID=2609468 RepID=UPI0020C3E9DC|nr:MULTISPECIES: hypothetical protein [unclassified Sphingobacterium]
MKNTLISLGSIFIAFSVGFLQGCSESKQKDLIEKKLISYQGRDTVTIDLMLHQKRFVGKYTVNGPGDYLVTGEVEGEIKADTLLGSLYYTPFGWRDKKRKAFALLAKNDQYLSGKGTELIYMGIPYFVPNTVTFGPEKGVYQVVE